MEHSKSLGKNDIWEHQPERDVWNEAKKQKFFKAIQMSGTLHPNVDEESIRDDEEAKNDFWTVTDNSFIVTTLHLESTYTCRKKKHFPFRRSASTSPERLIHP